MIKEKEIIMKRKELKNIAKSLAAQEQILQSNEATQAERAAAQNEIFRLSSKLTSLTEMEMVDEMVQEFLTLK